MDIQNDFIECVSFFQNVIHELDIGFIQDEYNIIVLETDKQLSFLGNIEIDVIAYTFMIKVKQLLLSEKTQERKTNDPKFDEKFKYFYKYFYEEN